MKAKKRLNGDSLQLLAAKQETTILTDIDEEPLPL